MARAQKPPEQAHIAKLIGSENPNPPTKQIAATAAFDLRILSSL
jgi:hypothetical protein|tara:strand:+ start:230 stop:361 length:132 start_codon:yes stop_codon:yes gene_type:complete